MKQPDPQIGGDHYEKLSPQPIEIIELWNLDPHRAFALKYIARCGSKGNPIEDIDKAIWYLKRLRELYESLPREGYRKRRSTIKRAEPREKL